MTVIPAAEIGEAGGFALASAPREHAPADLAVGIRPEAMRLAPEGVPAKVAAVEYLGADTLLDTRVGSGTAIVRLAGRTATTPGDTVHLTWDPKAAHWFALSTGRRIER
jgi:sn-glycerol 3-phosphate transport system ATP-binding protein